MVGVRGSNGICGVIKITITESKPNVEQHSTTFLLLPEGSGVGFPSISTVIAVVVVCLLSFTSLFVTLFDTIDFVSPLFFFSPCLS